MFKIFPLNSIHPYFPWIFIILYLFNCMEFVCNFYGQIKVLLFILQQTPSAFMAEMALTTDERLKQTYEMRIPQIIELLDMSETTHQKVIIFTFYSFSMQDNVKWIHCSLFICNAIFYKMYLDFLFHTYHLLLESIFFIFFLFLVHNPGYWNASFSTIPIRNCFSKLWTIWNIYCAFEFTEQW